MNTDPIQSLLRGVKKCRELEFNFELLSRTPDLSCQMAAGLLSGLELHMLARGSMLGTWSDRALKVR